MQNEDFEYLRDHILEHNKYFSTGFANAFKDDTTDAILIKDGKDMRRIMFADGLGNYFYLRNDTWSKYEAKEQERVTDNGAQNISCLDTMSVHLVAIVNNADAYRLIENLRNTVMMYEPLNILPVTSTWNREQVVASELYGMPMEDINATLQRLTDETIVRLSLSVSKMFIPGNCIKEPFNY
ncbi:MAG: hypothetical protein H6550_13630 [Chitinophagales bacterium]|nr:hypothetical protein [Chitinophagales bacterium]